MRHCSRHPVGLRLRLQLGLAVAIIALVVAVASWTLLYQSQPRILGNYFDTGDGSDLDLYLQDDLKFRRVGS